MIRAHPGTVLLDKHDSFNLEDAGALLPDQYRRWTGLCLGVAVLGYAAVSLEGFFTGRSAPDETFGLLALLVGSGVWFSGRHRAGILIGLWSVAISGVWSMTLAEAGDAWSGSWTLLSLIVGMGLLVGGRTMALMTVVAVLAPLVAVLTGTHTDLGPEHLVPYWANVVAIGLLVLGFLRTTAMLVGHARGNQDSLRAVVNAVPDALLRLDAEGRIVNGNDVALAAFFRGVDGPTDAAPAALSALELVVEDEQALLQSASEQWVQVLDRQTRIWEVRLVPVPLQNSRLLVCRDISEKVRNAQREYELREQLQQLQKLEAVGRVAGGVAHDFNNLLTAIGGAGELLAESRDDEARELAEELVQLRTRGTALTRQMLALARHEPLDPHVLDLSLVISDLRVLIQRLVTEQVSLELDLPAMGVALVVADRGQVEQVLLNLAANARDAMPGGGTLTLRLERLDTQLRLEVRDDGIGMDAATLSQAFDAFFTTKPRGKGTGLGLSGARASVESQGGTIEVRSTPGMGTAFLLTWPASSSEAYTLTPVPEMRSPAGFGIHILVVEDEPTVLRQVKRILERAGFEVTTAMTVETALAADVSPDMLLSDMLLPGGTGLDVAQGWRQRNPELPVLFMSGYLGGEVKREDLGGVRLLSKPFSRLELLDAVAETLEHRITRAS